jgi:23S rRNA pseudouridine2605 synthase
MRSIPLPPSPPRPPGPPKGPRKGGGKRAPARPAAAGADSQRGRRAAAWRAGRAEADPSAGDRAAAAPKPPRGKPPARPARGAKPAAAGGAAKPGDRRPARPAAAGEALRTGGRRDRQRPPREPAPAAEPREPRHVPGEPQRIAKLLARAGIASRREIERMIADGRVALDGKPLDTPATLLPSLKGVTVDGNAVRAAALARLFRYHKPPGVLTAERDFSGRPTIYDRLPAGLPRVIPVGRLDLNTEGLLLLTTDGELKRRLELPSSKVERTYRARVFGEIGQEQLEELIHGVEIEGMRYGAIDANLERRTGRNAWVEMRLTEGKNREVRRVLEYLGLQVSRLIRVAYGPLVLGDLPVGGVDEVRQHDLVEFRKGLR